MCIGFAAMASAAFSDAEDIQYPEAVDVLSSIGVINGYDDGTFKPEGTLTRAQAAKIIAYLVGADTITGTAPFDDCKGHWAESNIAYCASEGIVNGVGDNKFNPEGTLTGYAFAKMLLGNLGYDAKVEGMEGSGWEINVAKLIKATGLTAGIKGFDGTKAITREEACQMALNMLQKNMVEYDGGINITAGDVTISADASRKTLDTTFMKENFPKLAKTNAAADEYGRPATEWKNAGKTIGTYPKTAAQTIIVPAGNTKKVEDLLKAQKLTIAADSQAEDIKDIKAPGGVVGELFLNADGEVETIAAYYYMGFKVTAAKNLKSSAALAKAGATVQYTLTPNPGVTVVDKLDKETENTIAIGEWEKGDVVAYKVPITGADKLAGEVEEAELAEGKITTYKTASGKLTTATVGGTAYDIAGYCYGASITPDKGTEYKLYTDPNGFGIYLETATAEQVSVDDVVYIAAYDYEDDFESGTSQYLFKTVNTKGEYKFVKIAEDDFDVDGWPFVAYDSDKNTMTDISDNIYIYSDYSDAIKPGTKSIDDKGNDDKLYLASDVKFIFMTYKSGSFKSAKAFGNEITYDLGSAYNYIVAVEEGGALVAKAIYIMDSYTAPADVEILYFTGEATGNVDTTKGNEVKVYTLEGEEDTAWVKDADVSNEGFYEYTVDKNGTVKFEGSATVATTYAAKDGIYGGYYPVNYDAVTVYNNMISINDYSNDVDDADLAADVVIVNLTEYGAYDVVEDLTDLDDPVELFLVVSGKKVVTIFVLDD